MFSTGKEGGGGSSGETPPPHNIFPNVSKEKLNMNGYLG